MIAPGTYKAKALDADFGSAKTGTLYILVNFEITEGPEAGVSVAWKGFFTDATRERTRESLVNAGCTFPNGDIDNLEGLGDHEVSLVIEHEAYTTDDGEERTGVKVKWVNGTRRQGIKAEQRLDAGAMAKLRAEMKGLLLAKGAKAAPAGRAAPAPARGGGPAPRPKSDDDIPF